MGLDDLRTIYREGQEAFRSGLPKYKNPYNGVVHAEAWLDGWQDGFIIDALELTENDPRHPINDIERKETYGL